MVGQIEMQELSRIEKELFLVIERRVIVEI